MVIDFHDLLVRPGARSMSVGGSIRRTKPSCIKRVTLLALQESVPGKEYRFQAPAGFGKFRFSFCRAGGPRTPAIAYRSFRGARAGGGDVQPFGDNASAAGRAMDRSMEIVLAPPGIGLH
ncbi:hypothetical protein [Cupriavidus sp. PET2-C1]